MTDAKSIQTMTPEQLLARDSYAVVRFVDGAFAWTMKTFGDLDAAEHELDRLRRVGDYRVVRIAHAG